MKLFLSMLCLCLAACECCAEDAKDKAAPPEPNKVGASEFAFDGVWKPKGAMLRGVLLPPAARDAISLTIDGDKYEVTVKGEDHSDKGTFELDESVTPKRMTIKSTSGPNKGKTILAIYEIKGPHAMRVCYDLSGKAFPEEFKAPKNTNFYLVGYRRQKATDLGAAAENAKRLQGAWSLLKGESNGVPISELLKKNGTENFQIVFQDDTMKMNGPGGKVQEYRIKLDSAKSPKAIDTMLVDSKGEVDKSKVVLGIYEINGDTLKLCLANEPTTDRPKEFKAPEGSRCSWLILKRVEE